MTKVLFVCTGNICRSPTAHGVLRHFVTQAQRTSDFEISSAGISGYHAGENADERTISTALERGYDLSDIISRPVIPVDFEKYDYILAMDESHLSALQNMCPEPLKAQKKICLFMDYSDNYKGKNVPDPYFGQGKGFEIVLNMIEEASRNFLKQSQ